VNKDSLREFDGKDGSKKKVFSCEIVDSTSDMKVRDILLLRLLLLLVQKYKY
jgi:hypothetical protein